MSFTKYLKDSIKYEPILNNMYMPFLNGVPCQGEPAILRDMFKSASLMNSNVFNARVGIGFSQSVVAFGSTGTTVYRGVYKQGVGWDIATISALSSAVYMVFLDSRSNLFISGSSDESLLRSTDRGYTWTDLSDISTDMSGTSSGLRTMCEDENGWLYATAREGIIALYRSKDGGATWTKIVDGTTGYSGSGVIPVDHVHTVFYDHHHRVLISAHGDAVGSYVQISEDGGDTWTSWTASDQAVAITADADYIYYSSDLDGDRGLYRSSALTGLTGASAVAAATVDKVFDVTSLDFVDTDNGAGHCWWSWVDELGHIIFPYGAASVVGSAAPLMVSRDQGNSWVAVARTPDYVSGAILGGAHDMAIPSVFCKTWDGWFYHKFNAENGDGAFRWKILCNAQRVADYEPGYSVPGGNIVTPHQFQYCEGDPLDGGWSASTNGTATLQSTGQVQEGDKSVQFDLASGQYGVVQRANTFYGLTSLTDSSLNTDYLENPHWWMTGYVWIPSDMTFQNECQFIKAYKSTDAIFLYADSDETLHVRTDLSTKSDYNFDAKLGSAMIKGAWNKLKMHIFHAGDDVSFTNQDGLIQIWLNDELIIDALMDTNPTLTGNWTAVIGVSKSGGTHTCYVDNIECSYSDPEG